jgi:APA family basic amino acid/polyamine antiporter
MRIKRTQQVGWITAASIVVANMIGTGVFTSLGFQLRDIQNTWSIILLWSIGGLFSLLGAFSYAEIGTRLPKSGGEYYFLSRLYHPMVGYLSGWISLTVGFAAPIALAAIALGRYTQKFAGIDATWIAIACILLISIIHSISLRQSSRFQNAFTLFKMLLLLFVVITAFVVPGQENSIDLSSGWQQEIILPSFAVALVFVTYSYSGWNAAAYIVDEIRDPVRNLPRALIIGTAVVAVLYVFLQIGFLRQAPLSDLQNKVEIGQVVAERMFGVAGGRWISSIIGFLLISSISAMVWVGPRVTRAMANDYRLWQFLAADNKQGIPIRAIWLQAGLSIGLILTGSFEQVLLYSGFILQLSTTLTVAGVFILRYREGNGHNNYRSPGFPVLQILYLVISCWILIFLLIDQPQESLWGLINLGIGALTFWIDRRFFRSKSTDA